MRRGCDCTVCYDLYRSKGGVSHTEVSLLAYEGLTDSEIAARVGWKTRGNVPKLRAKYGFPLNRQRGSGRGRKWTAEMEATARQLLEEGASYAEVGRTVGIDRSRVRHYLPGYGFSEEQKAEYLDAARKYHKEVFGND